MISTCYVVANTLPPNFGWQMRARGLRAAQLVSQARAVFDEVRYLLFLERFHTLHRDRGFAILAPAQADTTMISLDAFEAFAERIEPATFVFTQNEFVEKAAIAAERHTVIYDILSLRELSLPLSGASEDEIRQFQVHHAKMLKIASRTMVNGDKARAFLGDKLKGKDVVVAPFSPPPMEVSPRPRTHLLFGGPLPRWADVTPIFRTMSAYLAQAPETPTIMLAPEGQTEDANALEYCALWLMANVTPMWNLSALNDAEILAMCFGYVEWAPLDEGRAHGMSLRTLQAVAAGVPVLHQVGTALDLLWDTFPGERLDAPITPADVARFVEKAKAGDYDEAVSAAQAVLNHHRGTPQPFEGLTR
ncbi:MAG: hypothetical protein AAGJ94_05800 [Pseudomonadota bacterium]